MESDQVNLNDIYALDYENKECVDCKTAMPKYVSINNSVVICQSCALRHRALGFNISYIREIKSDWDPYLLAFIHRGGNGRFIRLVREFEIEEFPIEYKYITKASEYHRLLIKSEVLAEEPPEKVLKPNGSEYCNMNECFFPEFENYQLYTGDIQGQTGSFSSNLNNSIKTVGKGIGMIYNTLTDPHVKEKVITGSTVAYTALTIAGNFLFQQSKPLMRFVSKKATEGIGLLYDQMKENLDKEEKETVSKQQRASDEEEDENFFDNIEESSVSIEEPIKKKEKKKKKPKMKAKIGGNRIRPKSIGKEVNRYSTIRNPKQRSTSINNLIHHSINQKPIHKFPKEEPLNNLHPQQAIPEYNEFNYHNQMISNSIQLENNANNAEMQNMIFIPSNNYPSYEEIVRNQPYYNDCNNNIYQPYQEMAYENSNAPNKVLDINEYNSVISSNKPNDKQGSPL